MCSALRDLPILISITGQVEAFRSFPFMSTTYLEVFFMKQLACDKVAHYALSSEEQSVPCLAYCSYLDGCFH